MLKIDRRLLDSVSAKATNSARKRTNHNFHKEYSENIQRFLNAIQIGTYLRPHKHERENDIEVFLLLRGRVLMIEFDDQGEINEYFILDHNSGNYGVEITPNRWHSFVALENNSVLYELRNGPFVENIAKIFPSWAPEEDSPQAQLYIKAIMHKINISI